MSAVLRATGKEFDVDAFLLVSNLPGLQAFHRGEPVFPRSQPDGRRREKSGIHVEVSGADFDEFTKQKEDAIEFLSEHADEIRRLQEFPGVQDIALDFGIWRREAFAQFDSFPAELVRLAGNLRLALELSVYSRES